MAASLNFSAAVLADGTVMAWGYFMMGGPVEWALKPVPLFKVRLPD